MQQIQNSFNSLFSFPDKLGSDVIYLEPRLTNTAELPISTRSRPPVRGNYTCDKLASEFRQKLWKIFCISLRSLFPFWCLGCLEWTSLLRPGKVRLWSRGRREGTIKVAVTAKRRMTLLKANLPQFGEALILQGSREPPKLQESWKDRVSSWNRLTLTIVK